MVRLLSAALLLFFAFHAVGDAFAQTGDLGSMDESSARDDFAKRAASAEADERAVPRNVFLGQKSLTTKQEWRRTTGRLFGFSLAGSFAYWIEGKFGKGNNASFHEQVFTLNAGIEAEFTFRLKDWVHGLFHGEYMYHKGSSGVFNGVSATISSFATYSLFFGAKFICPLGDVAEIDEKGIFANLDLYAKIAGGPVFMNKVVRTKPAPATTYWDKGTIWGLHLTVGVEWRLDEKFSFFVEHSFDILSPPHPSSQMRPENKASPFYFYVIQAGWAFYFD
jgi:hypothetical protein